MLYKGPIILLVIFSLLLSACGSGSQPLVLNSPAESEEVEPKGDPRNPERNINISACLAIGDETLKIFEGIAADDWVGTWMAMEQAHRYALIYDASVEPGLGTKLRKIQDKHDNWTYRGGLVQGDDVPTVGLNNDSSVDLADSIFETVVYCDGMYDTGSHYGD